MRLRADFGKIAAVTPDQYVWVPSPVAGVERMMLDRVGNEDTGTAEAGKSWCWKASLKTSTGVIRPEAT